MPSAKAATVTEASPSPPPLPPGPIPTASASGASYDQPINSLGEGSDDEDDAQEGDGDEDDGEEEEEEWDPSEERLPGSTGKGQGKGKGKATAAAEGGAGEGAGEGDGEAGEKAHPWQAVWSAEKNAWYFWNTASGEVTWTNPLDPSSSSTPNPSEPVAPPLPTGPPPSTTGPGHAQRRFGGIPEIDPDLAYLLPANQRGGPSDPSSAGQSAMFNARTGRFTNNDYQYTVEHLDEYNREKRFNNRYFDQDKWERERMLDNAKRKRDEEMGVDTTKKVTKKDMERFKKKKIEKRLRSQAWLRD